MPFSFVGLLRRCLPFLPALLAWLFLCASVRAASSSIVVSELQTAESASSDAKFVELHNLTGSPLDIGGMTLVYRADTSTIDHTLYTAPTGTKIPAHGFFLLVTNTYTQNHPSQGYNDIITSTYLSSTGGGVALFPGPPPADGVTGKIDSVGWGTATNTFVEGIEAHAPGKATAGAKSLERLPAGQSTQDTDNNRTDFAVTATPTPTSSAPADVPPDISAAFNPSNANPGDTVALAATVTKGTNAINSVTANLSTFGGSSTAALSNGGSGLVYTLAVKVPTGSIAGTRYITVTVTDAKGVKANSVPRLEVNSTAPPVTVSEARRKLQGTTFRVRGIVAADSTGPAYIVDADGGAGLMLADGTPQDGTSPLHRGDDVTVQGALKIAENELQLSFSPLPDTFAPNSTANTLPTPTALTLTQANNDAYQGLLARIDNVTVMSAPTAITDASAGQYSTFTVQDAGGVQTVVAIHRNATGGAATPYPGVPAAPVATVTDKTTGNSTPTIKVGEVVDITGMLGAQALAAANGSFAVLRPRDGRDIARSGGSATNYGDVNASGGAPTVADVALALRVGGGLAAGSAAGVSVTNGDVSPKGAPDGHLTVADAARILRAVAGLDTLP